MSGKRHLITDPVALMRDLGEILDADLNDPFLSENEHHFLIQMHGKLEDGERCTKKQYIWMNVLILAMEVFDGDRYFRRDLFDEELWEDPEWAS